LVGDLSQALMRQVPRENAALRLLLGYIDVVYDKNEIALPAMRHLVANHVLDLVALTLGATRDAAEAAQGRGVRAARLRAIKADIAANIRTRDLSAESVARRHHLSERYVRKLFETEGLSFSAFMLAQRLALAYRLLNDPRARDSKISSIALDAGFSDLSYFNRTFKRHYGMTPSEARAQVQRA
jgi:AraC-like DNA-binding protein